MTKIDERHEMRNRILVFKDRFDAGRVLGGMLKPVYGHLDNVLLLAIPMGGVPVAVKIGEILDCPMDLLIVRKIQVPGNTEAGFGAVTQEGDVFLNESLVERLRLTPEQIKRQKAKVLQELDERNRRLRGGQPFPDLQGKTVILVDDGLASGFTMKAAIHIAKRRKAAKTIVAVPTAPLGTIDALGGVVEEIYCANIREGFSFAVADAYENWFDLTEQDVRTLLSEDKKPGR
jgi:putative phosphoribosyl transferase